LTRLWPLILVFLAIHSNAAARTLAFGDSFAITTEYIAAQKAFFSVLGFEADDSEHIKAALKMRLFALEGIEKGIIDKLPDETSSFRDQTVRQYNEIFRKVVEYLIETYPVPEDAIRSYYLSYPDKFLKRLDAPKTDIHQEDLLPLDDALKKWIHDKIALTKKVAIIDEAYERLKQKYHVVIEAP